ncbi:carbohydrate ABC transporter permease [Leifsonia sp. ZF2019]|uniref:carbohydrate ABC transporter permease n=1 Tax=Leifsonia sp. ZF2019 TaxID=2781978 RepID=UPI001CBBE055|nr:carbohydrate ABC transporter permease [Leifsonia sp. ZF2019]UAJ78838.1 carbohydrate ABC transporter permease [Leifsonia sp. ZF2019]
MKSRAVAGQIALTAFVAVGAAVSLFPIAWIALTSVKTPGDYFATPFRWVPEQTTFDHFARLFADLGGAASIRNSLIVAFGSMLLTLVISVPAAYAIARARRGILRSAPTYVLSLRALPPVILLIPLYLVYSATGLIDTYVGLVLAFSTFNVPFAIWMLRGFFEDFPEEVQEAAQLDGLSEFSSLVRIVLPMIAPAIVVVAFFSFLASWNELMLSVTFTGEQTQTVTKLLSSLLQSPTGADFGAAAAIGVISMIPGIILVVLCQRFLVQGLTAGSVK